MKQKSGEISDEVPVNELVRYYSMCERALVSDWCLNKGAYSLENIQTMYANHVGTF